MRFFPDDIALNPPTCAEPVADPVIQPGPDPVTPASPVSQTPAVTEAFPHCNNEQVEQEVEILSVSHPVEIVPAAKLMDNFFTLEDSQDEEEISPLPTQKPKQLKKSAQAKAEMDEKARRKSYNIVDLRSPKNDFDRCHFAYSPIVWRIR